MLRACVIGWPVEHSRSPVIHRYWLKQYEIDGSYEKEAVPPGEAESFLRGLGQRGYVGANVTLPHKLAALKAADVADQAAYAIGAANTLWIDGEGKLNATNTDAYGFMTNLEAQAPGWNEGRRPVCVIGAGGAARAILYGLLQAGAGKILLANRTRDKAEGLGAYFGAMSPATNWIEVVDWEERDRAVAAVRVVVAVVDAREPRPLIAGGGHRRELLDRHLRDERRIESERGRIEATCVDRDPSAHFAAPLLSLAGFGASLFGTGAAAGGAGFGGSSLSGAGLPAGFGSGLAGSGLPGSLFGAGSIGGASGGGPAEPPPPPITVGSSSSQSHFP